LSSPYRSQYLALLLTSTGTGGTVDALARSMAGARVDLNPHQVDAALFALRSPLSKGVMLADEVGLGKTIEAGLVIAQRWAERRRRILVIVPAILRDQWKQELEQKFFLPCDLLDARALDRAQQAGRDPFGLGDSVAIVSYHFAAARSTHLQRVPWDLVVIDEAHRMRNVLKPGNRIARAIAAAVQSAPKLLLTATPLQNSLLELHGLVSLIDERVFGDDAAFRDGLARTVGEQARNQRLRERLRPLCIRTLRRQVTEYVPFTRRVPITQDFFPSDAEQRLYDAVSEYLQRDDSLAIPRGQRALVTLVLRKLLASSSFAIGATLRRLADRLEREAGPDAVLDELDLEGLDALAEELDEDVPTTAADAAPRDSAALRLELDELRRFAELADSIRVNAKGEALVPALRTAFARAEALGAPRKAVVFTESRRTQDYLHRLLSERGFAGDVVLLNGQNSDPSSRALYDDWRARRPSGSETLPRLVGIKAAIVEHFREQASILIATEAAAEGINLQFCSLVVNFDLPWNPQRIEQRIGRCHRYGQAHDVVVVNFLNRRNAADSRVFELLRDKFKLFDGVFGASDEVLGALESGVDLERRIAAVYQTCRTSEAIEAAFDALQAELETQIQVRLRDTRAALLEHFDEEVSERLRVHRDRTLESLDQRGRWLLELTRIELGDAARFDPELPRFELLLPPLPGLSPGVFHLDWKAAETRSETFYRQDHPLAAVLIERALTRVLDPAMLEFDYSGSGSVVSALKPIVGRSGWLAVATLRIESVDTSEFVLVAGETDDGTVLEVEAAGRLLGLPARILPAPVALPRPDERLEQAAGERLGEIERRNAAVFDEEVGKLDRWSADLKDGLERELKEYDQRIRDAGRGAALAQALAAKVEAQRAVRQLESERNSKRRELFDAQDAIDRRREALIADMESQLACSHRVEVRFVVRWTLS
jgi:adenine-specific DNA-methyltransferase